MKCRAMRDDMIHTKGLGCVLSFKKKIWVNYDTRGFVCIQAFTRIGDAFTLPTKHSRRGQFEAARHDPSGETTRPSCTNPARQHRTEGSRRQNNRKGPDTSSKRDNLTFLAAPGSFFFSIVGRYATFGPARETSPSVYVHQSCTLAPVISHRVRRKRPFGNRRRVGRKIACDDKKLQVSTTRRRLECTKSAASTRVNNVVGLNLSAKKGEHKPQRQ